MSEQFGALERKFPERGFLVTSRTLAQATPHPPALPTSRAVEIAPPLTSRRTSVRQYAESTIRTITIAAKTPIAMSVPVRLPIFRDSALFGASIG